MPTRSKRPTKTTPRVTQQEQQRIEARAALRRAVKREREIQRLTRLVERLLAASDSELFDFARLISERAGAIDDAGERQSVVNG